MISDSTMEIRMPPMTAMASGCSICEPAPRAKRQRQHAGHGGQRGHHDGAQAAAAGLHHRLFRRISHGAELWSASSSRMPFLATMPITMIRPMNDEMLNVCA